MYVVLAYACGCDMVHAVTGYCYGVVSYRESHANATIF
jgi:hypothetical protein